MSGRFGSPDYPSDLAPLLTRLDRLSDRLDTLEAPDGNQLFQTVKKLQAVVDDVVIAVNNAQAAIDANAATTALLASFAPIAAAGDGTYRAVGGGSWGTDNLPSLAFSTKTGKVLVTVSALLLSTGSATAIGTFAIYQGGTMIFSRDALRSEFKGIVNGVLGGLGASYTYPATGLPVNTPLTARFEIFADAGTIQFKSPVIVVQGTP